MNERFGLMVLLLLKYDLYSELLLYATGWLRLKKRKTTTLHYICLTAFFPGQAG